MPEQNILLEPRGRNTAPCIGLAAAVLKKRMGDGVMVVLSSDHRIGDVAAFREALQNAISVAQQDQNIVTLGIEPAYPETGYGYIRLDARQGECNGVAPVRQFVEKPDFDRARQYVQSGEYLWNSGMFVFKISTIWAQFAKFMPALHAGLERISDAVDTPRYQAVLEEEFDRFESVSIDYGVMEHAQNIYAVPGRFGWDDVGSWTAVGRIRKKDANGNAVRGDALCLDTHNCTIYAGARTITTLGVEDLVIVDTGDVLLVMNADKAQRIKSLLQEIREQNRDELL